MNFLYSQWGVLHNTIFSTIFETIDELSLIDVLEWKKKRSSNIGQFAVFLVVK
jgi:hypothetical protein